MKLLKRILVAADFSPGANDAVQTAVFVAKQFQSEIVLLNVVPGTSKRYSQAVDMIRTSVEEELHDTANRIRAEGIETVQTVVDFGIPFDQISRCANKLDVNVIIMGARKGADGGASGISTVAAEVRRNASKPVWIVKPGTTPAINRILCPVDFSDASGRALQNAIHLSRGFQAELTLLTVAPCLLGYNESTNKTTAEAKKLGVPQEQVLLDRFLQDFDFHNVNLNKLIRQGKPHGEILKAVGEMKADLLVMGSVGRKGLARMLIGGVARKIAREMPCSTITVRSKHAIRLQLDAKGADIEEHFKQGHELLAIGFPEEAAKQFRYCIAKDKMYVSAWEGLADVHERLGRPEEAKKCEEQAERVVQAIYHKEIEADVRSRHPLFRPIFGIKRNDL